MDWETFLGVGRIYVSVVCMAVFIYLSNRMVELLKKKWVNRQQRPQKDREREKLLRHIERLEDENASLRSRLNYR